MVRLPFTGTGNSLLATQLRGLDVLGMAINPTRCRAAQQQLDEQLL